MKQKSTLIASTTRLIQFQYAIEHIMSHSRDAFELMGLTFLARTVFSRRPRAKALILAGMIDNMSSLYALDPDAPGNVELYPLCGIPILQRYGRMFESPADMHRLMLTLPLIDEKE